MSLSGLLEVTKKARKSTLLVLIPCLDHHVSYFHLKLPPSQSILRFPSQVVSTLDLVPSWVIFNTHCVLVATEGKERDEEIKKSVRCLSRRECNLCETSFHIFCIFFLVCLLFWTSPLSNWPLCVGWTYYSEILHWKYSYKQLYVVELHVIYPWWNFARTTSAFFEENRLQRVSWNIAWNINKNYNVP